MFNGKVVSVMPYSTDYGVHIANWYFSGKYDKFFRHITRPLSYPEVVNYPNTMNCSVFMILVGSMVVGMATVHAHRPLSRCYKVGLMIDEAHQSKGFAPDSCISIANYLFNEANARKIIFVCLENDKRTEEVLKKGGLRKEATLKAEAYYHGRYVDELYYTMFKDNNLYKDYWRKSWVQKSEQPSECLEDSQPLSAQPER